MNRRTARISVVLAAATLLIGVGAVAEDRDEQLDIVRAKLVTIFEQLEPQDIDYGPIDGWFKIQRGSVVAYVSADGRYLLRGDILDLDLDVNLTELSRNEARRELMASVEDSEVIAFSPPDVRYSVTVFTDVECTYCRRLHAQIDEYLAQGIEVRYVLYPRNGPASRSWNTSENVWCAKDRNRALTAAKLDREFETLACDASIIQHNYLLGRDVGLSGTPAIVLESGEMIGGYVPPSALAEILDQSEKH